jgi:hypothetical protein
VSDTDAVIIEYRLRPLVEGWVTYDKLMATLAAWAMIPSAGAPAVTISKRVTVLGQELETAPTACENCGHAEHLSNPRALRDCPNCPCAAELREMDGEPAVDQSCDRCSHGCASCECTCPKQTLCICGHAVDEHSVYGCEDGCACELMPKALS